MRQRYSDQVRLHLTPIQMRRLEVWGRDHGILNKSEVMRRFISFGLARIDSEWSGEEIAAYHTNRGQSRLGFDCGMLFMVTPTMKKNLRAWADEHSLHMEEACRAFVDLGIEKYPNQLNPTF